MTRLNNNHDAALSQQNNTLIVHRPLLAGARER